MPAINVVLQSMLTLAATAVWAAPPAPSKPVATCDALVGGKCYVNSTFNISSFSSGAHHYEVCRSNDTTGWGGCNVVMATNSGSSYTVTGGNLPSTGFSRAYRFRACDAGNDCTPWSANEATYVHMDAVGPSAPGPTTTACDYQSSGDCWVRGNFALSVNPATDAGSGVAGYEICRSHNSAGGFAGCQYTMTSNGGTSFSISGSNLPSSGFRRSYWFRAKDRVANIGPWNTPLYVRVDNNNPTVSATNASALWFRSRTATVAASDAVGGSSANSGLAEVRYRWNTGIDLACKNSGSVTFGGEALVVPAGSNHLYLCARDQTGRVDHWDGGPYRVDLAHPQLGALNISSNEWTINDSSTYGITGTVTDSESGVHEIQASINRQGSNTGNQRGIFSWRSTSYKWGTDQVACSGGGFASKHPTAANPGTITLVGCTTVLHPAGKTVTFAVQPNESFGEFGAVNDVSLRSGDAAGNWTPWTLFNLDFSSETALNPDFSLAVTPPSLTLPRLRSRTYSVAVVGVDGFSNLVSLSTSGLPSGVTASFSPTEVAPGGSATLTLDAGVNAELGTRTFVVTGTSEGNARVDQAIVSVSQNAPTVTTVSPFPIHRGDTRDLTIRGEELMDATVYVATEPFDSTTPSRVYPTAQVTDISADGKRLTVQIDATSQHVNGFYNLAIETPGGKEAAQFRVTGPEPVIDMWTPSEPIQDKVHVFTAMGENLQGAQVIPLSEGVRVLDLDNSDPHALTGLLYVAAGTPDTHIRIRGTGGDRDLPLRPRVDMASTAKQTSPLRTQPTGSEPAPVILLQEPALVFEAASNPNATQSGGEPGCVTFTASRRVQVTGVLLSLFDESGDPLTQNILDALLPGDSMLIHNTSLVVTAFLEFEFGLRICPNGITDIIICFRGGAAVMVPAVGGQAFTFDLCVGNAGIFTNLAADGFISNFDWSSSSACVQARDLGGLVNGGIEVPSPLGTRAAEIEVSCCDFADLSVQVQGEGLGTGFDVGGTILKQTPACLALNRYDIEVRAFIPANVVGPADACYSQQLMKDQFLFFQGDDRGYSANPPPDFKGDPGYRMQQTVSVYANQVACQAAGRCDEDGLVIGSALNLTGVSSSYAEDALTQGTPGITVEDYDEIPLDCRLWHQSGNASTSGWSIDVERIHQKRVEVRFRAAAADPITSVPAPDVDWDIKVTVDEDVAIPRWEISGQSDCYPAYEVFINDKQVMGFMPLNDNFNTISQCLPAPMEIDFDCQGDMNTATPQACFQGDN